VLVHRAMTSNDQDTPDSHPPDSDDVVTERNIVVETEFKIVVRKLDDAARPRGVLAE
jgi:hypothetical protein